MTESTHHPIEIYQNESGDIVLDVQIINETVWLSLLQISQLFGRDKSVISRHINNVYKSNELSREATIAKYATVQTEGPRKIKRNIDYYNLDMIISVGYRVNSIEGVKFRQWALSVLKAHLVKGYTMHQNVLVQRGINELSNAVTLMAKTLDNQSLVSDLGGDVISIIVGYSKTWQLLLAYDEQQLTIPESQAKNSLTRLNYQQVKYAINELKNELIEKNEAGELFGNEKNNELVGILGNIEQTFGGKSLYKTAEERAANLLYFVIKDHPFSDGNKRIGSFLFLLYARF